LNESTLVEYEHAACDRLTVVRGPGHRVVGDPDHRAAGRQRGQHGVEPGRGVRVQVGGVDLACVPPQEWRRQIAWVPQDPHLFAASVAENIALGDPAAGREAIAAAARAAGADGFIEELPYGYDTEVGEHGLRLSSGQRQQIALARAFLRDAPLLLLDEPAAHLDADTAARLDDALTALTNSRTVIRISHEQRQTAGRVFILDHGRLSQASLGSGSSEGARGSTDQVVLAVRS